MAHIYPYQSLFHDDDPRVVVSAHVSLPAVVSNLMLLVDYVSAGSTVPTPWAWSVWDRFAEEEREARARLGPILIHGLMLQEHWIRTVPIRSEAAREWNALRQAVAEYSDDEICQLIANGCISGTQFYLNEMTRTEQLDQLLPENAETITAKNLLADEELFDSILEFAYRSWGVSEGRSREYVESARDAYQVRASILTLLDAVWKHGGQKRWEAAQSEWYSWQQRTERLVSSRSWADGIDAVTAIVGRTPPRALRSAIESAGRVVLLPCPEMGTSQRLFVDGETAYVMFEPMAHAVLSSPEATDPIRLADAVALVRTMTDPAAFSLLQALGTRDELYALELVQETEIHQSTVSRNLAALERYGVVNVRREGKIKHYQLQRDQIDLALSTVRNALGDGAQ